MPRVVAISDLHGFLPRTPSGDVDVPLCDILVLGGDICPDFMQGLSGSYDKGEARQANWLHDDFREWLHDARKRARNVVAVGGNHDFVFEAKVEPRDLPWTLLWDSGTVVDGLQFYGVPWCPKLGRWAFYADEKRLRAVYEAVPAGVDVLISHSPPHGYGDVVPTTSRFNYTGSPLHVGTHQLTNILHEKKPRTVVSGHIHEGRGRFEHHSGTVVYNVAFLTDDYEPHDLPACTKLDVFE